MAKYETKNDFPFSILQALSQVYAHIYVHQIFFETMYTIQKFANCGSSLLKSSGCDDGIPEQLKCPICYEVPSAEIFQCKNGHTICNRCLASVQQCPQCRIPFRVDGELIRVRALESLLDSMMVPCPYKSGGCVEIISRKQLKDHVINCVHK